MTVRERKTTASVSLIHFIATSARHSLSLPIKSSRPPRTQRDQSQHVHRHPRPLHGVPLRVALRGVADNHPSIVPMVTTIGMNIATIKTMKKNAAAMKTTTFTANAFVIFATYSSLKMRAAISPPNNKT